MQDFFHQFHQQYVDIIWVYHCCHSSPGPFLRRVSTHSYKASAGTTSRIPLLFFINLLLCYQYLDFVLLVKGQVGLYSISVLTTWVFPKIWVPQTGWFTMESPTKMDDLGVPLFSKTSTCCTVYLLPVDELPVKSSAPFTGCL